MTSSSRKEILVLDGLTILAIVMLVVNGVIAAAMYRWHNIQVFNETRSHQRAFGALLSEERRLKNLIVEHEGAESWEKSESGKAFAFRERGKKTFEHPGAGIAVDYPADYVKGEGGPDRLVLMSSRDAEELAESTVPREGPPTITLEVLSRGGVPIAEWVRTAPESNFSLSQGEYEMRELGGGMAALVYGWSGLYEAVTYAVPRGDSVVLLTVTFFTRGDDIVRDFDIILSTFRAI